LPVSPAHCERFPTSSDINELARNGFIRPGAATGPVGIRWTRKYSDEVTTGIITADLSGTNEGRLRNRIGSLDQHIFTVARPRHFVGFDFARGEPRPSYVDALGVKPHCDASGCEKHLA
jgi:hypothetical protein